MALNPMYVVAPNIQYFLVDRDSGLPLSNGKVFFYRDQDMVTPKPVYELQGNAANYTYSPLPNPLILSSAGTIVDDNGNQVVPYFFPFDAEGNQDLYYIVVQNAVGSPQFTVHAWPNPTTGGGSGGDNGLLNYVPNGQFLAHTNLVNNALVAGSNIIAQGGWTIELDPAATSVNTLTWESQQPTTEPPQSPRWVADFVASTFVGTETIKSFRLKFNDVNKFNDQGPFTFSFWGTATSTVPFTINVVKYFGSGSPSSGLQPAIPQETGQLTTSNPPNGLYNFSINFGSNDSYTVGPNNDDFVAVEIAFPVSSVFNVSLSDFVLSYGITSAVTSYPLQTNADMLSRGVAGWMDLPNPNGSDLYLPLVLTKKGMAWEHSQIGTVVATLGSVPATTSSSAVTNLMNADGSSYVYNAYSYLGIPYSRLGAYLLAKSPVANIPLFGTGANFDTAYAAAGATSVLRLTYNTAGTGSTAASDGNTGWTIGSIVTYNGSATGVANIGFTAYSNVAHTVLAVGSFTTPNAAAAASTSGFTVTTLNNYTGLLAQQKYAITVACVAASSLANPSSPGKYFSFSNSGTNFYMWFQITNETDPAPGGKTGIQVNLNSGYTSQDVANIVRETMNAYQISTITVSAPPSAGQYWLFSSNPASIANYYVWYTLNGAGSDPAIGGRTGIPVALVSADTAATTVIKTLTAINSYQFAAPNFQGMFLRGYDPTGIWDFDNASRWSSISGLSGANLGTFEYSQIDSHVHPPAGANIASITNISSVAAGADLTGVGSNSNTGIMGGSETRPVNAYVNYAIRY
jgi:hypothetical protein